MFGRLGVRGKILAVVAVPILVLLIAAGAVTFAAARTWDSARNLNQLLSVAAAAGDLGNALQDERESSVNFVDSFSQAIAGRARAENAVNSNYLALRAKVAGVSGPQRAAAADALAQVEALLGLKLTTDPATGVATVTSVSDVPVAERTGLYSLRALTYSENAGDWPTFPTQTEASKQGSDYAQVGRSVLAVSLTATSAGGISDAVAAIEASILDEATQAELAAAAGTLVEPIKSAQAATNQAQGTFRDAVGKVSTRSENAAIRVILANEMNALGAIGTERAKVRDRSDVATNVSDWFENTVQPLIGFPDVIAAGISQRPLARTLSASAAVGQFIDTLRLEEIQSESVIRQGRFTNQNQVVALANLQARTDVALESAQAAAAAVPGSAALPGYGASYDAVARASFATVRFTLAQGDNTGLPALRTDGSWPTYVKQELDGSYRPAQVVLWAHAQSQASANVRSSLLQTIFTALGAALVVLASLFIALVIARRIVNPLRRLTTTATAVRQELPRLVERVALPGQSVDVSEVQIPVESADEIGRLAEAFNAVNAATLAIAGEQAALRGSISEMFVNVARRDQVLLNRQLASIDEMERTQDDPETLMRLFALDHLATRMRRNSESLLVLAGIDSGRRMRRPMPLSDVIRTASSEIELYERIELILDADPSMVGHSALTAGHLFAELLENATVFSDPDTKVEVRTSEKDGSFVVEILDFGIGMTPEELRQANARVVSSAASEILGAQRLGLFVVGRIARRVGARVELQSEEGKGTTATVTLPRSLFDTSADVERPIPQSASTTDEKLHVPSALVTHTEAEEVDDFSAEVTSRAITGAPLEPSVRAEAPASTDDIEELIKEDVAKAPASTEVDLSALTTGVTASGLPTRRRSAKAAKPALPETTTILGLPERPTTGQLDELERQNEIAGAFGVPVTERRTAIFRSFRPRGSEAEPPSEGVPSLESDEAGADAGASVATDAPAKTDGAAAVVALEPGADAEPVAEVGHDTDAKHDADAKHEPDAKPEPDAKHEPESGATSTPESEAKSPDEASSKPKVAEVASDADVTDNGTVDKKATPANSSESDLKDGSTTVGDSSPAAETSSAKDEDGEGPMAPDWSLGQDPAISNGFSHGDVFADADGILRGVASEPLAIPGLEPASDDEIGFEAPEGAAPIPIVFSSREYPELSLPAPNMPTEAAPPAAGPAFAPVQPVAAATPLAVAGVTAGEAAAVVPKKRRGLFGRRIKSDPRPAPASSSVSTPFAPVSFPPTGVSPDLQPQDAAPASYEAPAPSYEAPAPSYEAPAPSYEAPAPSYEAPAPSYEAPAPSYDEPAASPFGDWTVAPAIPTFDDGPAPYSSPEVANVDASAYTEPQSYAVPDYAEPTTPSESFEVNYDLASTGEIPNPDFAMPGTASLEVPTIQSAPLDYGHDVAEAAAPQVPNSADPEFAASGDEPVAWGASPAEAAPTADAIPSLEADPIPAPTSIPEYPDYGAQPAYPAPESYPAAESYRVAPTYGAAESYPVAPTYAVAESYPAADFYADQQGYSQDQFAQPYGWEAAGAHALEAAGYEPDSRGYSPEAFSAPPPTEDYEADIASAVFSELRSLTSERPTIHRTKAGLTRREPSALATASAPAEVAARAVERDPETVRANFAGFYTGTTRGRADAAALPIDVHGSTNNEVAP
jgi:signal transduction histidine kinase